MALDGQREKGRGLVRGMGRTRSADDNGYEEARLESGEGSG